MLDVRVLADPVASHDALKDLVTWAETIDLAYAWAASAGGSAAHWRLLPLERVRKAILGIHFAQTEPYVLRELRDLGVLRVIADPGGVFHPKLIIGTKRGEARALVGSSNFTTGGFAGNTEVNVLLSGKADDPALKQLTSFIDGQWIHPRAFEPDEEWFEEYESLLASLDLLEVRALRMIEHVELPTRPQRPLLLLTDQVQKRGPVEVEVLALFNDAWDSLLLPLELRRRGPVLVEAFVAEPSYEKMPEDDRKLVAGWGDRTAGYYGRMQGAGYFKNLTRERPSDVGQHLDRIPLAGRVTITQARSYLNGVIGVKGVALGTATRLLCMKRPDLFLPANNASLVNIHRVFGTTPNTVEKYLTLVERIWQFPWFSAPEPKDATAARIWRARVALLDAIFYEPPEYLK